MKREEEIKRDMMELWRETFHDSSRYIELVFDNYFSQDNIFVRYHENRLIASLLSIPYEFQILTKEGEKTKIKGRYLCGLATHPDYRKRGIMTELMKEAEQAASINGYDLTFLIPADQPLREYYKRRGYENRSFRRIFKTTKSKVEGKSKMNIYSFRDIFTRGNNKLIKQISEWCRRRELESKAPTIIHSQEDLIIAMAENENSIFLTDETFDLEYPILAKVRGVVFPEVSEEADTPIRVVGMYYRSMGEGKFEETLPS
ncbi:MAG: GNAT family N-acetyltransferase, partial [Muribaculaceae bacterium]|nr:GNAT family N-acetyltransferase [Muribaculaceae bacterium]